MHTTFFLFVLLSLGETPGRGLGGQTVKPFQGSSVTLAPSEPSYPRVQLFCVGLSLCP